MPRPSWQNYFYDIAKLVSSRATCPRASVGAVIVKDKRVIATGYNGALAGEPHCTDAGCIVVGGHCKRTVHAEINALAQAARYGTATDGAVVYVYDSLGRDAPCQECHNALWAAGVIVAPWGGD
mgnify:CR=1 FL=1